MSSYFVEKFQDKYICGYTYYNGVRYVSLYVKSVYRNKYTFNLDYTHAKTMSYETALKHRDYMRKNRIGTKVMRGII